jgi:hypothetical protein
LQQTPDQEGGLQDHAPHCRGAARPGNTAGNGKARHWCGLCVTVSRSYCNDFGRKIVKARKYGINRCE